MPKATDKPTTKAELRRTLPLGDALPDTIARLRRIAAEAGDHLLLGDGPPHPDARLLEVCGEVLHARFTRDTACAAWIGLPWRDRHSNADAHRAWDAATRSHSALLKRASRLRATTPAGIYAKALAVRASRTGAAILAMSLAEDLLANPLLRLALWAAQPEPTPALSAELAAQGKEATL